MSLFINYGCANTHYTNKEQENDIKAINEYNRIIAEDKIKCCPDSLSAIKIATKHVCKDCIELIPLLEAKVTRDGVWWLVSAYQRKGEIEKCFGVQIRIKDCSLYELSCWTITGY